MARSKKTPARERTRRKLFPNPFLLGRATVPAYKVRLREKRVLWLVAIALALAGLGALLGTRLLSRPRQIRTTVKADLRLLDTRLERTLICLGGKGAKPDGSDLAARLVHRSLSQPRWPQKVRDCRRASALLLSTTSAIIASASAAPGRLSEEIRRQYRAVLTAASRFHLAVSAVADDALAGRRVPDWERCVEVGQAVGHLQARLSRVERSAAIHSPRTSPTVAPPPPPRWPVPASLGPGLPSAVSARFVPLSHSHDRALLLPDPDSRRPPLLLLDPFGQARLLRLRPPAPPGRRAVRWLDLVTPASTAFEPGLYWAAPDYDDRTGRASLTVGTTGAKPVRMQLSWPRRRGVAGRPVAGAAQGQRRLLVARAPRGLAAELVLFHSNDGGRTFSAPTTLATSAQPEAPVRLHRSQDASQLWLTYGLVGGGVAVHPLTWSRGTPAKPVTVDTGPRPRAPRLCAADPRRLYLVGGDDSLWLSTDNGRQFRTVARAPRLSQPVVAVACTAGRLALVTRLSKGYGYRTCGPAGCSQSVSLSWSRVDRVQLTTFGSEVMALLAGPRILIARRDASARGKLSPAVAVTRWARPPRDWTVVAGPNPRWRGLLLLDRDLRRLRTTDGGKSWRGE